MTELDEIIDSLKCGAPSVHLGRTVYFDETNNIRKGKIEKDRYNNDNMENLYFVLGGIATKEKIDFDKLVEEIGANKKQVPDDAKYGFFVSNHKEFAEAVEQKRLRKLFEYLGEKDVIIHFYAFHYLYFALTDFIDSIIEDKDINQTIILSDSQRFKSDFYEVLCKDKTSLQQTLFKYGFPSIPKDKADQFINEMVDLYQRNLELFNLQEPKNFSKLLLSQILEAKRNKKNLTFLEDRETHTFTERMDIVYATRMYNFKDQKIFDEEKTVENSLRNMDEKVQEKLNISFRDSKSSREIQISDAIVGFISKLLEFLNENDEMALSRFVRKMDDESYNTLNAFYRLYRKSLETDKICFDGAFPLFELDRFNFLDELMQSKETLGQ